MKPELITSLPNLKAETPAFPPNLLPGDIDSLTCCEHDFVFPLMKQELQRAGFIFASRRSYSKCDFTFIKGSVSWHTDDGCHLLSIMPVYISDKWSPPELVTKHGGVVMPLGRIVVFNASYGHAWVHNGECTLATALVKRAPALRKTTSAT